MTTTSRTDRASLSFLVSRGDLRRTKIALTPAPAASSLAPGQVLLATDTFAFTANNITYAVFGAAMGYWDFFPAPAGWGRIPVWGFGVVAATANDAVAVGERVFGYFPMSTHLMVESADVTDGGFRDASAHRAHMHTLYNQYTRCGGDPGYDPDSEALQMIFRPLFMTGFLIDDFLGDNRFFGAGRVVLSSASSKTALSLALQLDANHRDRCEVVGLTSAANVPFVQNLGCYHRVAAYGDITSLESSVPTVFVDMAGNGDVVRTVHEHFGDQLKYSCMVGAAHWDRIAQEQLLPGVQPVLFFAPAQAAKRVHDWGAGGLQRRTNEAWTRFLGPISNSIDVVPSRGPAAVERVYLDVLEGRATPRQGHVLSLLE